MIHTRVEVAVAALRGILRRMVVHLHQLLMTIIRDRHLRPCMRTRDKANVLRHIIAQRTVIQHRGAMHLHHPLELVKWHLQLRDIPRAEGEYRIKAQTTEVAFQLVEAVEGVDSIV